MSLPIQNIILGSDGVFYCATFIGVFTLFTWTYGLIIMGGKKDDIKLKKFLKNPGIIGIIIIPDTGNVPLIIFFNMPQWELQVRT